MEVCLSLLFPRSFGGFRGSSSHTRLIDLSDMRALVFRQKTYNGVKGFEDGRRCLEDRAVNAKAARLPIMHCESLWKSHAWLLSHHLLTFWHALTVQMCLFYVYVTPSVVKPLSAALAITWHHLEQFWPFHGKNKRIIQKRCVFSSFQVLKVTIIKAHPLHISLS